MMLLSLLVVVKINDREVRRIGKLLWISYINGAKGSTVY
ncbi:hypothetical protein SAMN05428977_102613 [Nitrosomonas sp. Nm166]|nr:hypothetical protein SAMN05428977_102613 [Nitrosomonas sp. Nm166]